MPFCAGFVLLSSLAASVQAQKILTDGVADLASQISSSFTQQQKRKVAIIPFRELDGRQDVLGTYLSEALVTELFKRGGFEIVERTMLDRILSELKLGQSGLIDPNTAKQVGQVAGVDAIVTGTVTDLQSFAAINCRLIDVQTGRVFAVADTKIVKDDDVRKIMGVELGQSAPAGGSPGQTDQPSSTPSIEWSDRSLQLQALGAERTPRGTRVTFLATNLTTSSLSISFEAGENNAQNWNTYLVDDLGMRFPAVGGSVFQPGRDYAKLDLVPNAGVRVQLQFDAVSPNARSVRLVMASGYISPRTFEMKTISLGPIPIGSR